MFEEVLGMLKFIALEIKEIMLLAFNLNFVDFYEEYKLRPESNINSFKMSKPNQPQINYDTFLLKTLSMKGIEPLAFRIGI